MSLSPKGKLSAVLLAAAAGITGLMKISADEEPHVPVKVLASSQSLSVMAVRNEASPPDGAASVPESAEEIADDITPEERAQEEKETAQRTFVQNVRAMEIFEEFRKAPPGAKKIDALLSAFMSQGREYLSAQMGITERGWHELLRGTAIEAIAILRKDSQRLASSGDYIADYRNQRAILEYMKYASLNDEGRIDQQRGEMVTQIDFASENARTYDQLLPLAQRQAIDYLRQTPKVTALDDPGAEAYLSAVSILEGTLTKALLETDVRYAQRLSTLGLTPQDAQTLLKMGKPLYDAMSNRAFRDSDLKDEAILKKFEMPNPG